MWGGVGNRNDLGDPVFLSDLLPFLCCSINQGMYTFGG